MSNPRLLLLDEVSLGLSPVAVDVVYRSLESLMAAGDATVILVEQDLRRAMEMSPARWPACSRAGSSSRARRTR